MREVHVCGSCGFVSTLGGEFVRLMGIKVCKDCKADYGHDPDVTRWIDEKRSMTSGEAVNGCQAQLEQGR